MRTIAFLLLTGLVGFGTSRATADDKADIQGKWTITKVEFPPDPEIQKEAAGINEVIKKAEDPAAASTQLQKRFKLTERQAEAILNMRLAKLTGLEIEKLEAELKEVRATIKELKGILASRPKRMAIPKPWRPVLVTGTISGCTAWKERRMSAVASVLPSSTTTIS